MIYWRLFSESDDFLQGIDQFALFPDIFQLFARFGRRDDGAAKRVFAPVFEPDAPVGVHHDRFAAVAAEIECDVAGDIEHRAKREGIAEDRGFFSGFGKPFDPHGVAGFGLFGGVALEKDTENGEKVSGGGRAVSGHHLAAPAVGFPIEFPGDFRDVSRGEGEGFGSGILPRRRSDSLQQGDAFGASGSGEQPATAAIHRKDRTEFDEADALFSVHQPKIVFDRDEVAAGFEGFDEAVGNEGDIPDPDPAAGMRGLDVGPAPVPGVVGEVEGDVDVKFAMLEVVEREAFGVFPGVAVGGSIGGESPKIRVAYAEGAGSDASEFVHLCVADPAFPGAGGDPLFAAVIDRVFLDERDHPEQFIAGFVDAVAVPPGGEIFGVVSAVVAQLFRPGDRLEPAGVVGGVLGDTALIGDAFEMEPVDGAAGAFAGDQLILGTQQQRKK